MKTTIMETLMIERKIQAAVDAGMDRITVEAGAVANLLTDLQDARNEICQYCGRYKQKHLGKCEGCRWEKI